MEELEEYSRVTATSTKLLNQACALSSERVRKAIAAFGEATRAGSTLSRPGNESAAQSKSVAGPITGQGQGL